MVWERSKNCMHHNACNLWYVFHINGAKWCHRPYKALFKSLVPTVSVLFALNRTFTLTLTLTVTIG